MGTMKSAPNRMELNKIRKMVAEGKTAHEIHKKLRIHLSNVEQWVAHFQGEATDPVEVPAPPEETEPPADEEPEGE